MVSQQHCQVTWKEIAHYQRTTIGALMDKVTELEAQVDALQNEVNAVEWVNGRMERELEAALRKCK